MSDDPVEESRVRTLLIIGAGAIAVAALVMFVLLPLLSGDDEPVDAVDAGGEVVVTDDPTAAPTEGSELAEPGAGGEAPAETFEVFAARDPFQQLVREDAGGGTGNGGTGTGTGSGTGTGTGTGTVTPPPPPPPSSGGTGTGDPTDGTGGDGTDGTGGDGSDGFDDDGSDGSDGSGGDGSGDGDGDGSANVGGTTVTLVDVFTEEGGERRATVTVNGTGYTVGEGQTFGERFRLLDISGSCATMLFGDSRFTLCEGERIQK